MKKTIFAQQKYYSINFAIKEISIQPELSSPTLFQNPGGGTQSVTDRRTETIVSYFGLEGTARVHNSSSCGGLPPSAEAFLVLREKKRVF